MSSGKKTSGKGALEQVVAREYTIHLHKRLHGATFKKRAPKAIKEIKEFAHKTMGTSDVRLDPPAEQEGVGAGCQGIRVRISRRRNDEEGAKEKLYSYVQAVNVKNPKGLVTTVVEE
ncbi:hypothetical protein PG997_012290 [Apiospora hydei]|uniref:60S ribosomal protein L31 n=1 Tax=Apiospora hydei TaxID=1337664 RepID=A0ABR1V300_9PEZI